MVGYGFWLLIIAALPSCVQLLFSKSPPSIISAFEGSSILLDWELGSNDLHNKELVYLKWLYSFNQSRIASLQLTKNGTILTDTAADFKDRVWFNTSSVTNSTPTTVDTSSSNIIFGPLNLSDEGEIICSVFISKKGGENGTSYEGQVNLVILVKPSFNDNDLETTAVANKTATLYCTVKSKPQANVTWFKNGAILNSTGSYSMTSQKTNNSLEIRNSLTINNVSVFDSGSYSCLASTGYANSTQDLELVVNFLPILTANSTTNVFEKGSNISLSCDAIGYPVVNKYIWKKNGVNLNYSLSTYNIFNFNKSNEGNYSCTPYNDIGAGDTIMHVLNVKSLYFTSKPTCEQKQAELTCKCDGEGDPTPSILWSNASNSLLALSSTVVLKMQISSNAIGVYTCTLSNKKGEISLSVNVSNLDYVSLWGDWGDCNATCGKGFKSRSRSCYLNRCTEALNETADCNLTLCPQQGAIQASSWYKEWYIVFWILIPIILILSIILCLWLARKRRNKKTVVVPVNRSIPDPPVRSIATQRDIYLPQANQLPAVNHGYTADIDVQEVEVEFNEESNIYLENSEYNPNAGNAFYKHYDQAGPPTKPKLSKEPTGQENPGYAEISEDLRLFGKKNKSGFV